MRIGEVLGNVTLSKGHPAMQGGRLLLVRPLSQENLRTGGGERLEELVVYDELSAGAGSKVGVSEGREAAMPFHPERKPVDAYNACILDRVELLPEAGRRGRARIGVMAALAALALLVGGTLCRAQSAQSQPRRPERIRTYDVQHIRTELAIDPEAGTIQGKVTHTLRPLGQHLRTVVFDCGELQVRGVRLGGSGANCAFQLKDSKLEITLDREYAAGDELSLAIEYGGRPKDGMHFVYPNAGDRRMALCALTQGEPEDTRHWLPCYDYPNDRATSETIVTVPRRLTVVSNGKLMETRDDPAAGTKTFHWRMDVPHSSYLISIVAGDLKKFEDRVGDLPLEYYVPGTEADEATVRRAFGKTPKMIQFFNERIGIPYPYVKYAQVVVPDFMHGGMENISATTLTRRTLRDEPASLEGSADPLLAHELAHQWFGDLITCRDWANIWLNEGFASYFDLLFTEHDRGRDEFRARLRETMKAAAGADTRDNHRPVVHERFKDANQIFDLHAYPKGAAVLHMLRAELGDEGFWKAVRHYAKTYREQVVDTRDLQKAVEEASGRKLDWFFEQWLYKPGCPELEVRWRWEEADQTARVTIKQVQKRENGVPFFRLPVQLEFTGEAGRETASVVADQAEQEFVFHLKQKPRMVLLDKESRLLKKVDFQKGAAEWLYQLPHSDDMVARIEAAEALAKLPATEAHAKALAERIGAEKCHAARSAMVTALGALKGAIAEEAVRKALSDGDARVRRSAAAALEGFAGAKVEEDLRRVLKSDPAYGPRVAALRSLVKQKPKDRWAVLEEGLRTPSQDDPIAVAALGLIVEQQHPRRREMVMGASALGNGPVLRREAIRKLVELGKEEPEIVAQLTRLVDDPSPPIRGAAASALRELGERSAVAAIEARVAKESVQSVKRDLTAAVEALKKQPAVAHESLKKAEGLEAEAKKLEAKAKLLRNQAQRLRLETEAQSLEKEAAGAK